MKLVAVDLDGTLLNKEGHVPEENAWALKKFDQQGGNSRLGYRPIDSVCQGSICTIKFERLHFSF